MSRSLPTEDPSRLGPFELTGRLTETPAGIVYRGTDPHGRQITLAVLNQGAADDAAARDRFRAAILAEPLDRDPPKGAAAIVGAEPEGPAPWVATLHEPGTRGAERFLAPVLLDGPAPGTTRSRRAPLFQPYWLGSRDPALTRVGSLRDLARDRSIASSVLAVAALLVLVAILLLVLYACGPQAELQPLPPPPSPTPATTTPSPTPTPTTPTPTRSGSPSPSPSDGGGEGAGGSA